MTLLKGCPEKPVFAAEPRAPTRRAAFPLLGLALLLLAPPAVTAADATDPVAGTVNDGTGADIDIQTDTTSLSANWGGFSDPESGIAGYAWAIGTTSGGTDVQAYTPVGIATSASNPNLSLTGGSTCYVSVRATNGEGGTTTVTSDGVQVVADEILLPLTAGYNLIALPLLPAAPMTASDLLQSIADSGIPSTRALRYNGTGYDVYTSGGGGVDFDVRVGEGYFVRCTAPGDWAVTGFRLNATTAPVPLTTGYNLIALPLEPSPADVYTASRVIAEIALDGGDATRVLRYNGTGYDVYTAGGGGTNFNITPGSGYFVRCTADSTWNLTRHVEPVWTFVSIPDFLNADIGDISGLTTYDGGANSTNGWHTTAIDYVLDAVTAENPDFVLVAGDLVNGHWNLDAAGRQIFGPVGTRAEKGAAIDNAANLYYPAWIGRFDARGLIYHAAVGDHEIGDNNWSVGSDKSHLVPTWKAAFARHLTLVGPTSPRYAERPVGTPFENTAYAFRHRNVLIATVDDFNQPDPDADGGDGRGSVAIEVSSGQLTWLEGVLAAAQADPAIDHILVQGHVPVLAPVRAQNSSGMTMPGGETTAFWQALMTYGVDLYLAGEVHHMTASNYGGVEQVAHGGILGYAPNINYLVGKVYPDRIELELKWVDLTYNAANTTKLWQAGSNRPREEYYVDTATGFATAGTLTIDKSGGDTVYLDRTGFFEWYGTFPPPPPGLRVHLKLDEAPGSTVADNAGESGAANNGAVTAATFGSGTLGNALTFDTGQRVLAGPPPVPGGISRTTAIWVKTSHATGLITMFTMGTSNTGTKWDVDIDCANGGVFELGVGNGRTAGSGPPLNDGTWHHVVIVLPDTGDSLADVLMYVDGSPITFTVNSDRPIQTSGKDLTLGHAANSDFFQQFFGTLDDLAIWSRALADAEVKALRNLGRTAGVKYNAGQAEQLFAAFAAASDVTVDGTLWQYQASGVGGADGDVTDLGGGQYSGNLGGGAGFVSQ